MSNASYVVNSRYNALYISPRIRPIVHILHKIGFIDLVNGSYDRTGSGNNNHTTRIRAAGPLHLLFAEMGLEIFQIDSHHQKECIILKDLDTDEEGTKHFVSLQSVAIRNLHRYSISWWAVHYKD